MDNYNNQNQYGQNTYNQNTYNQNAFNQNGYNQNSYVQFNQQPNQPVQPNYNVNEIPTYDMPQYQAPSYQTNDYQMPTYQSTYDGTYNNTYAGASQYLEPKKKKSGWLIALAIVLALGIVAGIFFAVKALFLSYDITDYDKVKSAAKEELGVAMYKYSEEEIGTDSEDYGVVAYAEGLGDLSDTESEIMWIQFEDEVTAKEFFAGYTMELEAEYEAEKDNCKSHSWVSSGSKAECSLVFKDEPDTRYSVLIVQKDDTFLYVQVDGDKDEVKKFFKKFKKALR
ncbi:MAG: hypothetical protein IIW92_00175 [Lachnospiraceae bacterium]|nr:hypothetical protein [Lachnospiraceae bacterium]